MNCIILGDRYSKGMKSKGCPALVKKDSKSPAILDTQFKVLTEKFKPDNIIYVYGFDSKRFLAYVSKNEHFKIVTVFNDQYDYKNIGYSLSLVDTFLCDNTLIVGGYNLVSKSMFKNLNIDHSNILVSDNSESSLGCVINNGYVENISYDLNNKLCNIFYLTKSVAINLKNKLSNSKYHNAFLFEILNDMIDDGIKLMCHKV